MSYFLDDDASQVRELKDKLEKLQSDFLSTQFSVSQENVESGQSTFPIANPSARGGGISGGGSGMSDPLLHTITTLTPQTLPTKTDINSALTNVFKITLDKDIEFDIINPNATKFEMLHIVITQDAGTARTITWPGSVNGTPTIDATLGSETTVSLFNMGDGTWRHVSTKGGTINFAGASKALDNLVSPVLNVGINFNSHAPTNFPGFTNAVGQALAVDGNGITWDMPSGDSYKHRINGVNIAEITSIGLAMAGTISMGENFVTIDDISTPANPGTGARRLFVDSISGELSVRTAGGTTVSLEVDTDGDLWSDPVDSDIIPGTGSIRNIGSNDGVSPKQFAGIFTDILRFDQNAVFLKKDTGTGNLELNAGGGDQINFKLGATTEWFISSSKLDGSTNTLRCGLIEFSTSVNHSIQSSTAGIQYFVPTGDTHDWKINSVSEMILSASAFDIQGKNLTLDTNQQLTTDTGGIRYKVPTGDVHDFQINLSSTMALSSSQLSLVDGLDISVGTTSGTKIGTSGSAKLGFFGVSPVTQRTTYTVSNHVTDRTYDANSTSVAELADVLGTLIVDLKSLGLIAT